MPIRPPLFRLVAALCLEEHFVIGAVLILRPLRSATLVSSDATEQDSRLQERVASAIRRQFNH